MHLTWAWWVGSEREGISKLPCGTAGGMGFCGLCGPRLRFFLCFFVSAGGLVFLRGRRSCCCWLRLFPSPRRKLSCHTHIYVQLTTNAVLCKHIPFKVIKISCVGFSPFSWHVRHKEVSGEWYQTQERSTAVHQRTVPCNWRTAAESDSTGYLHQCAVKNITHWHLTIARRCCLWLGHCSHWQFIISSLGHHKKSGHFT